MTASEEPASAAGAQRRSPHEAGGHAHAFARADVLRIACVTAAAAFGASVSPPPAGSSAWLPSR